MKTTVLLFTIALFASVAVRADEVKDMLKRNYFIEMSHDDNIDPEMRVIWVDSLIAISPEDRPLLLIEKANHLNDAGQTKAANQLLESMKEEAKRYPLNVRIRWMFEYSRSLSLVNNNLASLALIEEQQSLPKPDSLRYWDFRSELTKFDIIDDFGDTPKAEAILKNAETMLSKLQLKSAERRDAEAQIHGNKAKLLMRQGKFDEAYKEIQITRQLANVNRLKLVTLLQLASLYYEKREPAIAQKYVEDALRVPVKNRNQRTALYLLAICKLMQNNPEGALETLNQFPIDKMRDNSPMNARSYYIIRGQVYAATGDMERAYNSLDSALVAGDSIRAASARLQRLNSEQYLKASSDLRVEKRNNTALLWALIIVTALCLLMGAATLFVLRRNRRLRRNEIENRKELQFARDARELMRRQQEEADQYQELSEKRHSTALMKLSHIQTLLTKISSTVAGRATAADKVQEIKNLVREGNAKENMWDLFQMQLEETNHDFILRLTQKHPDLTKAELRMCIFILHNMPNKEIAEMLDRSPRTIEATKYNLRKKLGIEESTEEYLRKFL